MEIVDVITKRREAGQCWCHIVSLIYRLMAIYSEKQASTLRLGVWRDNVGCIIATHQARTSLKSIPVRSVPLL